MRMSKKVLQHNNAAVHAVDAPTRECVAAVAAAAVALLWPNVAEPEHRAKTLGLGGHLGGDVSHYAEQLTAQKV